MTYAPNIKDLYKSLISQITKDVKGFQPLQRLAAIVNRPPGEFILLSIMLVITATVFFHQSNFLFVLTACLYPSYMTLKATQSSNSEDRLRWLTYWLIIGFFITFDSALRFFLFFIPIYDLLRLLFVIALFSPRNDLSFKIYKLSQGVRNKLKALIAGELQQPPSK